MKSIEFERMLSARPKVGMLIVGPEPCLRDMAFDYYCKKYGDTDKANAATKDYTDHLFEMLQR